MLIAERNGFLVGGWKNPYVTDGLKHMWDAIWNVAGGVHSNDATTWKDLVANGGDWNITSGRTWADDALNVVGLSAQISKSITDYVYADVVLKRTSGRDAIFLGDAYHGCSFTPSSFFAWYNGSNSREIANEVASTRKLFSVDTSIANFKSYVNANLVQTRSYSYSRGTGVCMIGNAPNGAAWSGEVCAIRLYSRALTASEIAANYAVDKVRFNLP